MMQNLNKVNQNFRAMPFISNKKSVNRFERAVQIDLIPTSCPLFFIIQG
jgi:hypothetical protein